MRVGLVDRARLWTVLLLAALVGCVEVDTDPDTDPDAAPACTPVCASTCGELEACSAADGSAAWYQAGPERFPCAAAADCGGASLEALEACPCSED